MKRIYFFLLLLTTLTMSQAQENTFLRERSKENKLVQLDTDMGANFDLTYRRGGNMLTALTDKGKVYPAINFRLQHFFSKKWGWYTNIHLGIPKKYKRDCYAELASALEADYYVSNLLADKQTPDVNFSMDGGVAYRIENSRWAFYPRLGLGVANVDIQNVYAELKKKGGNELYRIEYNHRDEYGNESLDLFILSAGFTINYKLCRYLYLVLNTNYTQPIGQVSYNEYVRNLYNLTDREQRTYKSSTLARNLNVSIGVGFPIYLGGKTERKKISRREKTRLLMQQKRESFGLFPGNK